MNKEIYVYTTKAYERKSWYKIGETNQGSSIRVKQQDGTSNPEELNIVYRREVPTHCTDRKVHQALKDGGFFPVRDNREWFECPLDAVKSAVNEVVSGVSRPDNYKMREEQQDCCDKAVEYFNNGGKRFLINAKMRFGKTFTTYQIIKQLAGI